MSARYVGGDETRVLSGFRPQLDRLQKRTWRLKERAWGTPINLQNQHLHEHQIQPPPQSPSQPSQQQHSLQPNFFSPISDFTVLSGDGEAYTPETPLSIDLAQFEPAAASASWETVAVVGGRRTAVESSPA
jgi:hypothetical protein